MSLTPYIWVVAAVTLISVAVIFFAATADNYMMALIAGAIFASVNCAVSMHMNGSSNKPSASDEPQTPLIIAASQSNARLIAMTYAWGALVMISVYLLTGLYWFHAWQYASVMVLVGGALNGYAYLIEQEGHAFRTPAALDIMAVMGALQAIGAFAGVAFLVLSGKLHAAKSDWVANIVFFCGGVTIIVLSTIAVVSYVRIRREHNATA